MKKLVFSRPPEETRLFPVFVPDLLGRKRFLKIIHRFPVFCPDLLGRNSVFSRIFSRRFFPSMFEENNGFWPPFFPDICVFFMFFPDPWTFFPCFFLVFSRSP